MLGELSTPKVEIFQLRAPRSVLNTVCLRWLRQSAVNVTHTKKRLMRLLKLLDALLSLQSL